MLKSGNGSECAGKLMDHWAYDYGIGIDFSWPGKPTVSAAVEPSNGRFRQECLMEHWFLSLADAQRKIEQWRIDYNQVRPHSALEWSAPSNWAENTPCPLIGGGSRRSAFPVIGGNEKVHNSDHPRRRD